MKRTIGLLVCFMTLGFATAKENPALTKFQIDSGTNMVYPMRMFTWIKTDYTSNFINDVKKERITFEFDATGDYLVKVEKTDKGFKTIWGKQLLLQSEDSRYLMFTPFIASSYYLINGKEPIDIAFSCLTQFFSDETYVEREQLLTSPLKEAIVIYRKGGDEWTAAKNKYFSISENCIKILE